MLRITTPGDIFVPPKGIHVSGVSLKTNPYFVWSMTFNVIGLQFMVVLLAGEVVLASRQPVASVRLLHRKPCFAFTPVVSA